MNKSIVLYLLLAGLLTCFSCTHTKQQPEEQRMAGQPATRISIWHLHRLVGRDGVQDEKRR